MSGSNKKTTSVPSKKANFERGVPLTGANPPMPKVKPPKQPKGGDKK